MLDGTNTATASAEANFLKAGDFAPSINGDLAVNFNLGPAEGSAPRGTRLILGLKGALDPRGTAADISAANLEIVRGKIKAVGMVRDAFPFMSDDEAILFALGYRLPATKSTNVFETFGQAEVIIENRGETAVGLPDPETFDALINGAAGAFRKEDREAWAKIIADETTSSLRCQSLLDEIVEAGEGDYVECVNRILTRDGESELNRNALKSLYSYDCIKGVHIPDSTETVSHAMEFGIPMSVLRTDYPTLPERMKIDRERELETVEDSAVERAKDEISREMRRRW